MSQTPEELLRDHDFTEQEWNGIRKSLGSNRLNSKDCEELVVIKIIYTQNRFKENAAGWFEWTARPAEKAKRLQQVSTAAKKLRIAMQNAKLDMDALPLDWQRFGETAEQLAARPLNWDSLTWKRLTAEVLWLEKASFDNAQRWSLVKAPPANVDPARDDAWASLAEFYVRVTGDPPTASPRASKKDNQGEISGGFGALVASFMAAFPEKKSPTGDEIRGFLRSRQFGERMKKFLDAHHGLLKEPRPKRPLRRS